MRHLGTLSGNGNITPAVGQSVAVRYELDISQEDIPDGFGGTIPGIQSICGSVRPACGAPREILTLRMEDGRALEFYFTVGDRIAATGAIRDRWAPVQ